METSILVALSRQDTLARQLDVVANNLANMNTTAFKAERMMFADHLGATARAGDGTGDAVAFVRDRRDGPRPLRRQARETGKRPRRGAGRRRLSSSSRRPRATAIRATATCGSTRPAQLVTDDGLPVLAQGGTPMLFAPEDTQIAIARDGTISSETRRSASCASSASPTRSGCSRRGGPMMAGDEQPEAVAAPAIRQGMLEGSNVEPIIEMDRLIRGAARLRPGAPADRPRGRSHPQDAAGLHRMSSGHHAPQGRPEEQR